MRIFRSLVPLLAVLATFSLVPISGLSSEDGRGIYKVISDTDYHQFKRTIEVRLNRRVSAEELKAIAVKLKSLERKSYERTFIVYYLPDMEVGKGAWATTNYDPDLQVNILGSTENQLEELNIEAQKKNISRDMIGSWLIEQPYLTRTITIFKDKNKVTMEVNFKDGSIGKYEMVENKSSKGRRFQEVDYDEDCDYYILNNKGELEIWDSYGLVIKGKKI